MGGRYRTQALPERPNPGRTGRQARLPLRVGGRAPLSGGIFPLPAARGLPRRRVATHQADSARPWDHSADHQPPGAGGGEGRVPRSGQQRARRIRDGRGRQHHRTRAVRPGDGEQAGGLGRRRALRAADVQGRRLGIRRPVFQIPAAQRAAEADPEAASPAVGGLQPTGNDRNGGPLRYRRAGIPVPVGGNGECLGARLL